MPPDWVQKQWISIHALREEGDQGPLGHHRQHHISIHALREEGDIWSSLMRAPVSNFYPRPPRGGRPNVQFPAHGVPVFLSTPSARRATGQSGAAERRYQNFYPRPPRGGRHPVPYITSAVNQFLSTPSARRATQHRGLSLHHGSISIHALREEGDIKPGSAP